MGERGGFRPRPTRSWSPANPLETRQHRSVVTPHALLNGASSQAEFRRDLRFGAAQPRLPDNPNSLGHPSRLLLAKQSLQFLRWMMLLDGHSRPSCQDDGIQILASAGRKSRAVAGKHLFLAIRIRLLDNADRTAKLARTASPKTVSSTSRRVTGNHSKSPHESRLFFEKGFVAANHSKRRAGSIVKGIESPYRRANSSFVISVTVLQTEAGFVAQERTTGLDMACPSGLAIAGVVRR